MKRLGIVVVLAVVMLISASAPALAGHQWLNYHWKRTNAQVTIVMLDATTSAYRSFVTPVVQSDWDASTRHLVNRSEVANDANTRSNCPRPNRYRRIRVCNYNYGAPWLGRATVWAFPSGHLAYGRNKIDTAGDDNDTRAERKHTACQEFAHTLGLDHRPMGDTCMRLDGVHPRPDGHDYEAVQNITHHHSSGETTTDPTNLDDTLDVGTDPCYNSVGVDLCTTIDAIREGHMHKITLTIYKKGDARQL